MELRTVVRAIRRRWMIVAIVAATLAALAGGVTALQAPTYTATAQGLVSVSDPEGRPPYALASGSDYILYRMTSYAELGVTTPVLSPVVSELQLAETPLSLSGRVFSHSLVGKAILEVTVSYNDPGTAAKIADSALHQVGIALTGLERGNVILTPLGPAVVPVHLSNRNVPVASAVGATAGVVLGCLIAVGAELIAERRRRKAGLLLELSHSS